MALSIPIREPGDFRFTARQSNWFGGYNRLYYQEINKLTEPRFWDSFNVATNVDGEIQLAPLFERVQTDASDKKPKLYAFNSALYRLDGVSTPALYKTTNGTTWSAVSMASGPTGAPRGAAVWKNQLIVAATADTPFRLSSSDTWSTYAAPVAGVNVDMVGVGPDDKLLAWVNGRGLYDSIDGTTWVKRWPTANDPDEATCDILDGSVGTVLIATSDSKGSSIHEYFSPEGAAANPSVVTWMQKENEFYFCAVQYGGAVYFGGKKGLGAGSTNGQGVLYRKERSAAPRDVQYFGDGIREAKPSADFSVRGLALLGEDLWVGAPMRSANPAGTKGIPGVYWYNVDSIGVESVAPNSAIDTSPGDAAGLVYGAGVINGEVLITTATGTWKRSATNKAIQGYLETAIYDLRSPDHVKSWRFVELLLESATSTEAVATYYRTGTLEGTWLGGTSATASGAKKITLPDDNASAGQYKLNARQVQLKLVLSRGADATKYPRVTSVAVDAAQIKPVGVN